MGTFVYVYLIVFLLCTSLCMSFGHVIGKVSSFMCVVKWLTCVVAFICWAHCDAHTPNWLSNWTWELIGQVV